jgi:phosphatidylserine/phosphatidylglycerophosphate/cardiolipin synthase-like enzyme
MKKIIRFSIAIFLLYLILGTWLPNLYHKTVPENTQETLAENNYLSDTTGTEKVSYVLENSEAMQYRLKMIESAKHTIELSTFDFNSDETGKQLIAAMLNSAKKGVKVRIIVDGISGCMDFQYNNYFKALASNENVSIKIYNRINILLPWQVEYRMHDKYLIIDDKMYLLGGRNTTEIFLKDECHGKNIDSDAFVYETGSIKGTSMEQLKQYFNEMWELKESSAYQVTGQHNKTHEELLSLYNTLPDIYPEVYNGAFDIEKDLYDTGKITLLSNPIQAENKAPVMWYAVSQIMKGGKDIVIHTPYIILSNPMYKDLTDICNEADSVKILINDGSSGANPWGCTDYMNQRDHLLKTGARMYEFMGNGSMHTKNILVDDRISIIGSYNFDMRSTYLDTEVMLVIDSKELNSTLRENAREDMTYCKTIAQGTDYEYGTNYETREMSSSKKVFYAILRVLIKPFRNLL